MSCAEIVDEETAHEYHVTQEALRDVLYRQGYKRGRINREINNTMVEFTIETIEEDFARAFSYLVPYEKLLKEIKLQKAELSERIRIRKEEAWRFG